MGENILVDSHVWVEDPETAWTHGVVLNIKGDEADVKTNDGTQVIAKLSKLYPKDDEAPSEGVEDMTRLSYLHEPAVLNNLATRYELNEIYETFLLLSIPFKDSLIFTILRLWRSTRKPLSKN